MAGRFLVMVRQLEYLVRFESHETVCTKVPSIAAHFSYLTADSIVAELRARGFNGAMVAGLDGLPATTQAILDTKAPVDEDVTVKFGGYYFGGRDRTGSPTGIRDRREAVLMSRRAAEEVASRLKRMGFKDVEIIEYAGPKDLSDELSEIWGSDSDPSPDLIVSQD